MNKSGQIHDLLHTALGNPKRSINSVKTWLELREADLDIESFISRIAEITDQPVSDVETVFDECPSEAMGVYDEQIAEWFHPLSRCRLRKKAVGSMKYARLDRIALYCIVRLQQPKVVVETGVKWGESSLFILEALKKNGSGHLYSFDAGIDVAGGQYPWPDTADEVGFLVGPPHEDRWTLVIGDAVEEMEETLPDVGPVDLFYHDSLHTYEYMMAEFETVLPYMADGGLLVSEDIDENDAWTQFLARHADVVVGDHRYYSLEGISRNREIGATVVST